MVHHALSVPVDAEPVRMLLEHLRTLLTGRIQRPNPRIDGDSVPAGNLHIFLVRLHGRCVQHDSIEAGLFHMGKGRFHVDLGDVLEPGPEHRVRFGFLAAG